MGVAGTCLRMGIPWLAARTRAQPAPRLLGPRFLRIPHTHPPREGSVPSTRPSTTLLWRPPPDLWRSPPPAALIKATFPNTRSIPTSPCAARPPPAPTPVNSARSQVLGDAEWGAALTARPPSALHPWPTPHPPFLHPRTHTPRGSRGRRPRAERFRVQLPLQVGAERAFLRLRARTLGNALGTEPGRF